MYNDPIAYFITFTTYGTWLHGDPRSSVIIENGSSKVLEEHIGLYRHELSKLASSSIVLDSIKREIVRDTILKHCDIRCWRLYALHIRTNHVHVIVKADKPIEQVSDELKGWPTRKVRERGFNIPKMWTKGSSKVFIFSEATLREKIHYVVYEQGEMMESYIDEMFCE